jgi:hypothetical protein
MGTVAAASSLTVSRVPRLLAVESSFQAKHANSECGRVAFSKQLLKVGNKYPRLVWVSECYSPDSLVLPWVIRSVCQEIFLRVDFLDFFDLFEVFRLGGRICSCCGWNFCLIMTLTVEAWKSALAEGEDMLHEVS